MSYMTSIIQQEIRELLTPGSVISVLVMVILFVSLGGLIRGEGRWTVPPSSRYSDSFTTRTVSTTTAEIPTRSSLVPTASDLTGQQ